MSAAGRGLHDWLARNTWLLTVVNLASGCCFLAGSYLFFFADYSFEGTAAWLAGSGLMLLDGIGHGVLRHGAGRAG